MRNFALPLCVLAASLAGCGGVGHSAGKTSKAQAASGPPEDVSPAKLMTFGSKYIDHLVRFEAGVGASPSPMAETYCGPGPMLASVHATGQVVMLDLCIPEALAEPVLSGTLLDKFSVTGLVRGSTMTNALTGQGGKSVIVDVTAISKIPAEKAADSAPAPLSPSSQAVPGAANTSP
jgi:hypothetical protein